MNKLLVSLAVLLGATSAFAQADNGVTVSSDPARAAAVERHAQELQSRPAPQPMAMHKHAAKSHAPAKAHVKAHAAKD